LHEGSLREIDHKITHPRVDNYLYAMLPERTAVLAEIEKQADERDIPIVGPAVGRLLYQYARLIGAKQIFEMGSAVGYSTIWWAMAVGEGGKVHYTDGSRKNADEARDYFERASVADRIEVHVGDALEVLSERKEQFDVLFCDMPAWHPSVYAREGCSLPTTRYGVAKSPMLREILTSSRSRSRTAPCGRLSNSTRYCTSRRTGTRRSFR